MQQPEDNSVDVVINGAGMVGAALACLLAQAGMRVVVLEPRTEAPQQLLDELPELQSQGYDARVSALTLASQALLSYIGAWPVIEATRAAAYQGMEVWDGLGRGHIHFSAADLHEPYLGHIVENRVTLAALYQCLLMQPGIEVRNAVQMTALSAPDALGGRWLTLSQGEPLYAPLLIGADGAESLTRQLAGIPATAWDYGHHALVTSVTTEASHQWQCWQRFTEDGPLAFLPLASETPDRVSIVWSTSPAHARALLALDDEAFCDALSRASDTCLGRVLAADPRQAINLRQRHAHSYVVPGVVLAGDAAHTIHPLAGQGVNLGFLDVAALAEVLIDAHAQGETLGHLSVLRRYQRMRRSDNLRMSATMEMFRRLFGERPAPIRLLRGSGMNLVNHLSPLKNHLASMAMGLDSDLPRMARRDNSAA
ncbi:2-octaprenyl-3-methyl-6-methoxy-1,4-benzoquinol hydroxylase [Nitrincola sp. A-D6]|uniref:UbiH/UbiF/VisC/COQ6 family ubiquinone biosynthesis hydroxylase n=1 Tax=Nitrincola sp. A-D6 TaxID=1545442 RepID=UPI00051F8DDA|nr:UbiH/UbiF/VisC/COQ6 family ubiquinone biosynthesis hydroxylase [Nitrincola sp. A-D6]KGK40979.1 2-octaprenyl-3-methyl-6-methoxy-1,4-benzoquinol hydroxylase [Nitrincola sp. A-D6]